MANWKQINEGWWINLDRYEQVYIETLTAVKLKCTVYGLLDNKEVQIDYFDSEVAAQQFIDDIMVNL